MKMTAKNLLKEDILAATKNYKKPASKEKKEPKPEPKGPTKEESE